MPRRISAWRDVRGSLKKRGRKKRGGKTVLPAPFSGCPILQGSLKALPAVFRLPAVYLAASKPNSLCSTRVASSIYFSSISTDTLISEVEII